MHWIGFYKKIELEIFYVLVLVMVKTSNQYTDLESGHGALGNGALGNGHGALGNGHGDGKLGNSEDLWVGSLEDNLNGGGVQSLPPEIRVAFIQKIYCLLSLQLLITWAMSYGVYVSHTATLFVLNTPGALVVATLGTFLSLFLSWCYGKSYPVNYFI